MDSPGGNVADRDRRLLEVLDRGFDRVRRRAGEHLRCAVGCSDCCSGPFPVTRLDVWRLRRGLDEADPELRNAIATAASRAVEVLRDGFPGDAESGRLTEDEPALDRFFVRHASLPCPVLDLESGACRLWEHRPVACRTYGPPLAFDTRDAPHCKLCFTQATPRTIEACRWSPDRDGLEQVAMREFGVEPGSNWETLIAHALHDEVSR